MTASPAAIELIKRFEGFRANAYQDEAGVWTVGFGSTGGVRRGDTITEEAAAQRLRLHVEGVENVVSGLVPLTCKQAEFDALVCLCYNIGSGALKGSTLIRKFLAGKKAAATAQFSRWNKIGQRPSAGLSERRSAEAILFAGDD